MQKQKNLSIGQLAKMTSVSVRSIRHYEQCGLLDATRSDSGYRYFDETCIETVQRITVLLRNGFTLDEIKPVASMFEIEGKDKRLVCADVIRLYQGKLVELDERIAALQSIRNRAANRLDFLIAQRKNGGPN